MHSLHPRFLLTFASFLASVFAAGWSLDTTSCSDPKIQQQIRDSMKWVFDRADDALAQLNKDPMNIDVQNLYNWLWPTDQNPADPESTKSKVKRTYQAIAGMRQEVPKAPFDPTTAIVYCNVNRFTPDKKKPNDFYHDADLQRPLDVRPFKLPDGTQENPKQLIDGVKSSNPFSGPKDDSRTKAFTWSYSEQDQLEDHRNYFASQITIAPWYGELSLGGKFDQSKGFSIKKYINKKRDADDAWKNREIDFLADFKVTLFHEMAHSRQVARALNFEDQPCTNDLLGYGWNKLRDGPKNIKGREAVLNADTYAYFALIIGIIKDLELPQRVDQYGSLVALAQELQRLVRKFIEWVA